MSKAQARLESAAARRERLRAHAALFAVQLAFGLFPLFGLFAFGEGGFAPRAVACLRILVGAALVLGLAAAAHGRRALPPRALWPRLVVCSWLGVAANQLLYLEGLSRSNATHAGLVMCGIPVFTFLAALLLRQERFEARRALGVVLALLGGVLWALRERPELVAAYALGDALMVANTLCYAFYLVLSRPLLVRLPPLVVLGWVYALSIPLVPFLLPGVALVPDGVTRRAVLSLGYVLLVPTVFAYLGNLYALARVRASTTAIYVYLQPLFAGLAGALWLDERPTPALLLCAALVFVGIRLVAARPAPARGVAAAARDG